MPVQLFSAPTAGFLFGQLGANPIGWLSGPMGRDADYAANRVSSWLQGSPNPPEIINAYYAGRFGPPYAEETDAKLFALLNEFGIFRDGGTSISAKRGEAWKAVIDLARPFLNFDNWLAAYRNEFAFVDRAALLSQLGRVGILDPQQQSIAIDLGNAPSVAETQRYYFSGFIDTATAKRWIKWAGVTNEEQIGVLLGMSTPLDMVSSIVLRNRDIIDDTKWRDNLALLGYGADWQKNVLTELLKQIPGPSDLVRFALREVWDQNVVERFGYDEEFPIPFKFWMDKQGLGWSEDVANPDGTITPGIDWPHAYWRSHWQVISPSQAYEMLHRLRPDAMAKFADVAPDAKPFTIDDVRTVLKIADYPKPFRDRLAAISYRPIGIRQVRMLVANQLWGQRELLGGFQDEGYSPSDSRLLAELFLRDSQTQRMKRVLQGQKNRVLKGYEDGLISRQDAEVQLYLLEVGSKTEYDQFYAMPRSEQIAIAQADQLVQSLLDGTDTDQSVRLAQTAIVAIRKAFLRLDLSRPQSEQALLELGVTQIRVTQYLNSWEWEFFGRGKSLSVAQIQKTVVRGLASPAEAIQRLQRLGYQPADALALVQMWLQDRTQYLLRAEQSLARSEAQRQKALIAQQRELKRQLNDLRHRLSYNAPVNKLKKWLAKGLIGRQEASMRMAALGHDAAFITREIADATSKLTYTAKKRAERVVETPIPPTTISAGTQ